MSSRVLLATVTGDDAVGVVSGLTAPLAEENVELLDVDLLTVHETVHVGMLLHLPDGERLQEVSKLLMRATHEMGMNVRMKPILPDEYRHWRERAGHDRFILTLLAGRIAAAGLHAATAAVAARGIAIDVITRLSGRPAVFGPDENRPCSCIELSLRGEGIDADGLKKDLLEVSRQHRFDVALQRDDLFRRQRRLVAFDMDSTVITIEVIDELAKRAGSGDEVRAVTEAAMRGEIDFTESLRRRVRTLAGLDAAVIEEIAGSLPLTPGAERTFRLLKRMGCRTALLTGGFRPFAERLQQILGIDHVRSNGLQVRDGKLTGELEGPVVDGQAKADALREMTEELGILPEHVVAVGDGANDLPMLQAAGMGIAFNAKPAVRDGAHHALNLAGLDGVLYLMGFRDEHC